MKNNAPGKIRTILNEMSPEQRRNISSQIEVLMKSDMRYVVKSWCSKYQYRAQETFGWAYDDLEQQVRIAMWKGLATFDTSQNVKLTTYLSAVIENHFKSLSKKCRSKRNARTKLLCVEEVYEDKEIFVEGLDDWLSYSSSVTRVLDQLNQLEKEVLALHLVEGVSINTMVEKLGIKRHVVISVLKSVKLKIKLNIQELVDEEDTV